MPQPTRGDFQCNHHFNAILKQPELAAKIGAIAANWSCIEDSLTSLFILLGYFFLPIKPGAIPVEHSTFIDDFNATHSINVRLTRIITRLKAAEKDGHVTRDERMLFETELAKQIRKVSGIRGKIIHAVWGISDKYEGSILMEKSKPPFMVYNEKDLDDINDTIRPLINDLGHFMGPIFSRFLERK